MVGAPRAATLTTGVCLTATDFDAAAGWFKVDVAPETLLRTNLGKLHASDRVNCERAMNGETRFGGHMVQGHVDTVAELVHVERNESALTLRLRLRYEEPAQGKATLPLPSSLSPYLIPKGYITLDGASLTLIDVSPLNGGSLVPPGPPDVPSDEVIEFTIMLIPHTQDHIALPSKSEGALVNVEFDMVGKYVYRSISGEVERLADDRKGGAPALLERMVDGAVKKALGSG